MSTITPNLGLKKPMGNEIVNRQAYNENLDLLDQNVAKKTDIDLLEGELNHLAGTGRTTETVKGNTDALNTHLAEYSQEVVDTLPHQSITLSHGLNAIRAPRASLLKPKFTGRTLVNLLGKDGNCEDAGKWVDWQAVHVLDASNRVYGSASIKATCNTGTNGTINLLVPQTLKTGVKYLVLAEIKLGTATNSGMYMSNVGMYLKNNAPVFNASNFATVWKVYSPANNVSNTGIICDITPLNGTIYVDGIRLYEITQAEYNALDNMTDAQIAAKYPYVDSVQVVQNPAVKAEGVNLLPPFSQWILDSHYTIETSYSVKLTPTDIYQQGNSPPIPVLPGQNYTLVVPDFAGANFYWSIHKWSSNKVDLGELNNTAANKIISFTVPNDVYYISIHTANQQTTGSFVFRNPMLVFGDIVPDHFVPHDPSFLYLQTPLYEGETLEEIDGQWVRTKKWEKKVLDGSLDWQFYLDFEGYKSVSFAKNDFVNRTGYCVKYDGKILKLILGMEHGFDGFTPVRESLGAVFISIPDTDSGWGDSYTPTVDEIKAYFYGWKMYDNINPANSYSSGTKAWVKITCKNGDGSWSTTTLIDTTNTCPTVLAGTDTNKRSYIPYQLHYQLAYPTMEVVPYEGKLRLHEGLNQVGVFEGIVVRELVNPYYGLNYMNINHTASASCLLKYKTNNILTIFKDRCEDLSWQTLSNSTLGFGGGRAYSAQIGFDPTAQYSVTYIALPEEFTAPCPNVQAELTVNLKTTVDSLVDELANVVMDVTTLEMALRNRGLLRKNPIYAAKPSAIQTVVNDTVTNIIFDYPIYDIYNQYSTDTTRFTCKMPGYYLISARILFSANGAGYRYVALRLNDSMNLAYVVLPSPTGTGWRSGVQALYYLNPGDYITVNVQQTSGTTLSVSNVLSETGINIVKVGD